MVDASYFDWRKAPEGTTHVEATGIWCKVIPSTSELLYWNKTTGDWYKGNPEYRNKLYPKPTNAKNTPTEFKVGDYVYVPSLSNEAIKIENSFNPLCPLNVKGYYTTYNGKLPLTNKKVLFHATVENQKLLEALYGEKFEEPPPPIKTKSDLTRHLLKENPDVPILCDVHTMREELAYKGKYLEVIKSYCNKTNKFITINNESYEFAVPFDQPLQTVLKPKE